MIIEFGVQNFGSVKDKQVLSFEATDSKHLEDYYTIQATNEIRVLKLILIYGANASGKTTILTALELLRDLVLNPAEKKTDNFDFEPFLFDPITPTQNTVLTIDFLQNEVRYNYYVEFDKKAIVKEELSHFKPNRTNIFRRTTNLEKRLTEIKFGYKIRKDKTFEKILEANTLWNNTVLGGFLKTNIELNELKEVTDWFSNYLKPLIFTRTDLDNYITDLLEASEINKHNVIEILKKADFHISDIVVQEDKELFPSTLKALEALDLSNETIQALKSIRFKKVNFEHTINNTKYYLPFDVQSEGTKRYYSFAGLLDLLVKNPTAITIDEIEASLHPDLLIQFIITFLLNSSRSQILATTHYREILSNKNIFRNDAICFTDKNQSCATKLYSLADFGDDTTQEIIDVYNAYKVGKLGGVPHLGDYFIDIEDEKN